MNNFELFKLKKAGLTNFSYFGLSRKAREITIFA